MKTAGILTLAVVFLAATVRVEAVYRNLFYYFGDRIGDRIVSRGDMETAELYLETPISFYNDLHYTVYVNTDGVLTFTPGLQGYAAYPFGARLQDTNIKLIAPFMVDLDNSNDRQTGNIWYRETSDVNLRQRANQEINRFFSGRDFKSVGLLIVTWEEVAIYKSDGGQTVTTFQLILANDGTSTYSIFLYDDQNTDPDLTKERSDWPEIGFYAGDRRRYFTVSNSMTRDVFQESRKSNVDKPGYWLWQIGMDSMGDRNIVGPSQAGGAGEPEMSGDGEDVDILPSESVDVFDVDVFDVDHSTDKCNECALNARCVASGLCCECIESFYGNGLTCLEVDQPQRVNGKVTGNINGDDLGSADLHAYAVTNEGRAYTAVSRIPPSIGYSMQALQPLGAIIGWMFAMMESKGRNGFDITGGQLTRTANVAFQTGESVVIKERYEGVDDRGYMRMTAELDGDVPLIEAGIRVTMDDYKDTYNRISPGFIRSYSERTLHIGNDRSIPFTVDQTIEYEECVGDRRQQEELITAMRSSIKGNYMLYDSNEQILRYAMTSKVTPSTDPVDNPCQSNDCDRNANCVPQGDSYACECRRGFQGDGRACYDVDECAGNRAGCHRNARCVNEPGSYYCECLPGYTGNGRECTREGEGDDPCESSDCDSNVSDCVNAGTSFYCLCHRGYATGEDGRTCYDIDECAENQNICHRNARCVNEPGSYYCECLPGYDGDGRECTREDTGADDAFLIFAQGMALYRLPLNEYERGGRILIQPPQTAVGVGFDCVDSQVYWTDVYGRAIYTAKYDGSEVKTLINTDLSSPEGIAIDWISRNMYWTDSGMDRIEMASLDGRNRRVIISDGLVNPRAIAVDPVGSYLYWIDWNRAAPKIETSNLDGSDRHTLVDTGLQLPNGLTLDYINHQICWADAGEHTVECISQSGDASTRYTVTSEASYPFGLTNVNNKLYWTDWDRLNIQTVDVNGGNLGRPMQPPIGANGKLYGITAITSCPYGSNACAVDNGQCSHLCIPLPGGRHTCKCPSDQQANEVPCVE